MSTSKVSLLDLIHSTDVCRFHFDTTASTAGSMDPMESFGSVWRWLRGMGTSQVSASAVSRWFLIDTLDLDVYRFDLHPIVSRPGSNDLNQMFQIVCGWLHGTHAYPVSCFDFSSYADVYRLEFDSSASTALCNKSVRMFCGTDGWPRRHW